MTEVLSTNNVNFLPNDKKTIKKQARLINTSHPRAVCHFGFFLRCWLARGYRVEDSGKWKSNAGWFEGWRAT
jgi:hypothetical protein